MELMKLLRSSEGTGYEIGYFTHSSLIMLGSFFEIETLNIYYLDWLYEFLNEPEKGLTTVNAFEFRKVNGKIRLYEEPSMNYKGNRWDYIPEKYIDIPADNFVEIINRYRSIIMQDELPEEIMIKQDENGYLILYCS